MFPPEIEFQGVTAGPQYVITFTVQNADTVPHRVRIDPPTNPNFTVDTVTTTTISPGLDLKVDVTFSTQESKDCHDSFYIAYDNDGHMEIPLHAYFPHPQFEFQPFIDFGRVVLGNNCSSFIEIRNEGLADGIYEIEVEEGSNLKVSPSKSMLKAKPRYHPEDDESWKEKIRFQFTGNVVGSYRGIATVHVKDQPDKVIDISATVVDQKLEVLFSSNRETVDSFSFGPMYYGQQKTIPIVVVNNGPEPCTFMISHNDGSSGSNNEEKKENDNSNEGKIEAIDSVVQSLPVDYDPLVFTPKTGLVNPYEEKIVNFTFKPKFDGRSQGFKSEMPDDPSIPYSTQVTFECSETRQMMTYSVSSRMIQPMMSISTNKIDFGDCPTNDRLDHIVTLTNECKELPMDWCINKIAHFHCNPTSGTLYPSQSLDVVFSFIPTQLGKFKSMFQIVCDKGLTVLPLRVQGTCNVVGNKTNHIQTMKEEPKFAINVLTGTNNTIPPKWTRPNPCDYLEQEDEVRQKERLFKLTDDAVYTFGVSKLEEIKEHKMKYNNMIKESRIKKEKAKKEARTANIHEIMTNPDGVDLGIPPFDGLLSPRLPLPPARDPLYLKEEIDANGKIINKKPAYIADENVLIKKKFKPNPSTPAEARACQQQLSDEELADIRASPTVLDFGKVSTNSKVAKSFCINNDLHQCILVSVDYKYDELKLSKPKSQVIPPGTTAGFDVIMCAEHEQNFEQFVYFTINGIHKIKVRILALVIPIIVEVSRDDLFFKFPADNLESSLTQTIRMNNPGNVDAEFIWSCTDDDVYSVSPPKGLLKPNLGLDINVKYTPQYQKPNDIILKCVITGGKPQVIRCRAEDTPTEITYTPNSLDMSLVPVGMPTSKEWKITNPNTQTPVVVWAQSNHKDFTVSPDRFVISPKSSSLITVTIKPNSEQNYSEQSTNISLTVRGGKSYILPIRAEAKIPEVLLLEDEYNMGDVIIGGRCKRKVTIENRGSITALMLLDLSKNSEFTIDDYPTKESGDRTVVMPIDKTREEEKDESNIHKYMKFQLIIEPKETLKFNLLFYPKVEGDHSFEFPLTIIGVGSNPNISRVVTGNGVPPRLLLSTSLVDFGMKVVPFDRTKLVPYHSEITLTNQDTNTIDWQAGLIVNDNENQIDENAEIFTIAPMKGQLLVGETMKVHIEFLPEDAKSFKAHVPIFLDHNLEVEYMQLGFKGSGAFPKLEFDCQDIILPIVPLNTKAVGMFYIINSGYETLDLKYKIPLDQTKIPLELSFPNGKVVNTVIKKIPVVVTFTATKSMSFTARIDFNDNQNNRFSINVTGTSDNCLLSNYPYLLSHNQTHTLYAQDKRPVQLYEIDHIKYLQSGKQGYKSLDTKKSITNGRKSSIMDIDITPPSPIPSQHNISFLLDFISQTISTDQITSIEQLKYDDGVLIYKLLGLLTNKRIPGMPKVWPTKPEQKLEKKIEMYNEMLNFLKSHGALLNTVDAKGLLSSDDYVLYKTKLLKKSNPDKIYQDMEIKSLQNTFLEEYPNYSLSCWTTLLYQIIRILVLFRVSPINFFNLPGVKDNSNSANTSSSQPQLDASITGSNIYGISENLLLRWLTIHHHKMHGAYLKRVINFTDNLTNGVIFIHLVLSHVSEMGNEGMPLAHYNETPSTDEDKRLNIDRFLKSLQLLKLTFIPNINFFTNPNDRDMLLFVLYLYQTLPQFLPKTTIVFTGSLGEKIVKNIQLRNPSNKTILYTVEYSGSSDFKMDCQEISLEPGSSFSYPIEFVSRFSKSVKGKLVFSNKRDGGLGAAAMVFRLESQITSRHPTKTIRYEGDVYINKEIQVEIENPFNCDGRFEISIDQKFTAYIPPPPSKPKAKRVHNPNNTQENKEPSKNSTPLDQSSLEKYDKQHIFDKTNGFTCSMKYLAVVAKGSTNLTLNFLPFFRGTYECNILFLDPQSGEFIYQFIAEAKNPPMIEKIRIVTDLIPLVQKTLIFPPSNLYLDQARNGILEKYNGGAKTKVRDILQKATQAYRDNPINFKVECSSPYFTAPDVIPMQLTSENSTLSKVEVSNSMKINARAPNTFTLSFQPKAAGLYTSKLILVDGSDCRYYTIDAVVNDKNTKAIIEFCSPAGQKIKQTIPLMNNTDEEWNLDVDLKAEYFKGPKKVHLDANSQSEFELLFSPPWICDVEGELTLTNVLNGEKFYFSLKGKGEDPLALDNYELSCQARETITQEFLVYNDTNQEQVFKVESDIPHISGDSTICVPAKSQSEYTLSITPLLAGIYSGTITFVGEDERYQWYTMEVTVSAAPPMEDVDIHTTVRLATTVNITLANPLEEAVDFDVNLAGEGLIGSPLFHLEPLQSAAYELLFNPLVPGEQDGSIAFIHNVLGEFWYKLHLVADQAEPVRLKDMVCAVGSKTSQSFIIENPIGEDVTLKAAVSNLNNYKVTPSRMQLKGYSTRRINVEYFPSSINNLEPCNITFVFLGRKLGELKYTVDGHGTEPGLMDNIDLTCVVNESIPGSLFFHNPFPTSLAINISLEIDEKYSDVISLLLKKSQQTLSSQGNIQIPILFSPKEITTYEGLINLTTVGTKEELKWSYPFKAVAEAPKAETRYEFKCRAREGVNETLDIKLHAIESIDQMEYFDYELIVLDETKKDLLNRSLVIEPLLDHISSLDQPLRYQIRFTPTKPIVCEANLVLNKQSGGRWRYDLLFESSDPLIDDVITIESSMNQTSSVSFNLQNQFVETAKFEAYFTPETPIEFSVYPMRGVLQPYGSEGTQFIVSFSPKEYGNTLIGKLLIVTDEMMWTYEIRGTFPNYSAPKTQSKVSARLTKDVANKLSNGQPVKKNYLTQNIKKVVNSKPPKKTN